MSALDISSAIIKRVEAIPETCDYVYIGLVFSLVLSLVPAYCRLCEVSQIYSNFFDSYILNMVNMSFCLRLQ